MHGAISIDSPAIMDYEFVGDTVMGLRNVRGFALASEIKCEYTGQCDWKLMAEENQ